MSRALLALLVLGLAACDGSMDGAGPAPAAPAASAAEVCGNGVDDNADGLADESCPCTPGREQACYDGPAATRGVGQCKDGLQRCQGSGEFGTWGGCEGAVGPAVEICEDGIDNDCNGLTDQYDPACAAGGDHPTGDKPNAEEIPPAPAPVKAQACTTATLTHVTGSADCAANHAVFMIDDGKGPNLICCPLPATDILSAAPPVVRAGQCAPNEVITGAVSAFSFKCTAISSRYRLGLPAKPCYFGDGAAGSDGVKTCAAHPASFTVLQKSYFGSDGCSGFPYGSLFVKQTGDECKDMAAVQLAYSGKVAGDPPAGTLLPMFEP